MLPRVSLATYASLCPARQDSVIAPMALAYSPITAMAFISIK